MSALRQQRTFIIAPRLFQKPVINSGLSVPPPGFSPPPAGLNTYKSIQHAIVTLVNAAQTFTIAELNLIGAESKDGECRDGMGRI